MPWAAAALLVLGQSVPALAYADARPEFPVFTAEQLRALPYQEALRNLELARSATELDRRRQLLQFADQQLRQFLADNPSHEFAFAAQLQLGALLVERARLQADVARKSDPENPYQSPEMLEARGLLQQAEERFDTGCQQLQIALQLYRSFIPPDETELIEQRENVRRNLIEGRMYRAASLVELARTFEPGSDPWRQHLETAAEAFERNYEDYRTMMAGLLARLKQGQCYQELGDTKRALGLYANLLAQPATDPGIRALRAGAMFKSLECWLSPHERRDELAMVQGEQFLEESDPADRGRPEWLAVQYYTAVASRRYALRLPADRAEERNELLARARELAVEVSQRPGTLQAPALQLIKQLDAPPEPAERPAPSAPTPTGMA